MTLLPMLNLKYFFCGSILFSLLVLSLAYAGEPTTPSPLLTNGCGSTPELRTIRALDFGGMHIMPGKDGFLSVSPRGAVINSVSVMVVRQPSPSILELCGGANQNVAITIDHPSLKMTIAGGRPAAREVKDFELEGDGIRLQRAQPGRWEGQLGPSGRATVYLGGTLYFSPTGLHGAGGADFEVNVEAR